MSFFFLAVIIVAAFFHQTSTLPAGSSTADHANSRWIGCEVCKTFAGAVQIFMQSGLPQEEIVRKLDSLCRFLMLEKPDVCLGVLTMFSGEVFGTLDRSLLDPNFICSSLIGQSCANSSRTYNWSIDIPERPAFVAIPQKRQDSGSTLKVLQLSDIHVDMEYQPGTSADCGKPLCCQSDSGIPLSSDMAAGKWGHRLCDLPPGTFDGIIKFIAENHKNISFILWTGDIPAHDIWKQPRAKQLQTIKLATDIVQKLLPNIKVYPVLGNHEGSPVDSFPPPFIKDQESLDWLLASLRENWKAWLPSDALDTVERGGFYQVSVTPGLRLVSLNLNFCNRLNFWLMLNFTDPADQLQWLVSVLLLSEKNHEKVYIVGHIPPGSKDCFQVWSHNYHRIVERFASTIVGQFYGHTHFDEIQIFFDILSATKPISMSYIAPSLTPYQNMLPAYRIYEVDSETWDVVDHHTYVMDLNKTNTLDRVVVQLEYSAKSQYQLSSLTADQWFKFVLSMDNNDTTFKMFSSHYYRSQTPCDRSCRKTILCQLLTASSAEDRPCQEFIS